jgi:hypothetical protein
LIPLLDSRDLDVFTGSAPDRDVIALVLAFTTSTDPE